MVDTNMNNNDIVPGFDDENDDKLNIRLNKLKGLNNLLVLYLAGLIDSYNTNRFQKRVNKAIEAGFINLIFHCGGLNYISSTGIGSLTDIFKTVKRENGDLVLIEMQPKVFEVFGLIGFLHFLNIKENLNNALTYFRKKIDRGVKEDFPKIFVCPNCSKKLKANKPGRFRCPGCKTIIVVDERA